MKKTVLLLALALAAGVQAPRQIFHLRSESNLFHCAESNNPAHKQHHSREQCPEPTRHRRIMAHQS